MRSTQKMDLGPCPKAHQEKLQIEYNMAKLERPDDPVVNRIEQEWISNIYSFVDECDRRINASQRRLEKTPEENAKTTALVGGHSLPMLGSPRAVSSHADFSCCAFPSR